MKNLISLLILILICGSCGEEAFPSIVIQEPENFGPEFEIFVDQQCSYVSRSQENALDRIETAPGFFNYVLAFKGSFDTENEVSIFVRFEELDGRRIFNSTGRLKSIGKVPDCVGYEWQSTDADLTISNKDNLYSGSFNALGSCNGIETTHSIRIDFRNFVLRQ
jgi:hypothetical protein